MHSCVRAGFGIIASLAGTTRYLQGGTDMKLYYHPVSTTSRPVWLFIAENGIDCELKVVDLMKGEHYQPEYVAINPNRMVPVLEDGDFRLTESSAILKYLAEKTGSSTYPKELRLRAKVNEMMDWINTQVCVSSPTAWSTRRSSPTTSGAATRRTPAPSPGARKKLKGG